jgi:hypothetical protein
MSSVLFVTFYLLVYDVIATILDFTKWFWKICAERITKIGIMRYSVTSLGLVHGNDSCLNCASNTLQFQWTCNCNIIYYYHLLPIWCYTYFDLNRAEVSPFFENLNADFWAIDVMVGELIRGPPEWRWRKSLM